MSAMAHHVIKDQRSSEANRISVKQTEVEKRKCTRVPVFVPISCVSLDNDSIPLDQNMGVIKDVSQTGVGIEATQDVRSEILNLTFIGLNNETVELKSRVVFSRVTSVGTFKVGVRLLGKSVEIENFVKKLVRYHHYMKNIKCED